MQNLKNIFNYFRREMVIVLFIKKIQIWVEELENNIFQLFWIILIYRGLLKYN